MFMFRLRIVVLCPRFFGPAPAVDSFETFGLSIGAEKAVTDTSNSLVMLLRRIRLSKMAGQNLRRAFGKVEKCIKGLHVAINGRKNDFGTGGGTAVQPEGHDVILAT